MHYDVVATVGTQVSDGGVNAQMRVLKHHFTLKLD